jgi:dephospho-CoA kinase
MHPAVKSYIKEEIERERAQKRVPFLVVEAALLIEDHYDEICQEIWYIHTDREVRVKRLMESRGYTRKKAEEIMKSQLSDEIFSKHSQFVVDNSSDFIENVYEQIDRGLVEHEFL